MYGHDFLVFLEDDMFDIAELQGMGQREADEPSTHDDDSEWLLRGLIWLCHGVVQLSTNFQRLEIYCSGFLADVESCAGSLKPTCKRYLYLSEVGGLENRIVTQE
jgi:hypothetical protein